MYSTESFSEWNNHLKGIFFVPTKGRVMEIPFKRLLENTIILL